MPGICPNCGSGRPDRFCSRCGQNDRDYMRGVWSVVYEFFREMFEVDSRLFRTLKSLLFKPGHLSSEFSRNRRATYMSPVRLYLFTSFLFFLVLSISAGGWLRNLDLSDADVQMGGGDDDPAATDSARAAADSVLAAVDSALADRGLPAGLRLGALVDSVLAAGEPTTDILADSASAEREPTTDPVADSATADRAQAGPATALAAAAEPQPGATDDQASQAIDPDQLETLKARLAPEHARKVDDIMGRPGEPVAKQVVRGLAGLANPDERAGGVPGWLIRYGRGLVIDAYHSPEAFLQRAIGNLPIAMFFLLPVFAMILGVCYLRRKRFFVEHLVFGMHIHTFVFLMLAAALLVPSEPAGDWVKLFVIVVSPLYVLIAMRRFYGEGWGRTLVKGFVVWNLYSFVLFPGLALALLVRA